MLGKYEEILRAAHGRLIYPGVTSYVRNFLYLDFIKLHDQPINNYKDWYE